MLLSHINGSYVQDSHEVYFYVRAMCNTPDVWNNFNSFIVLVSRQFIKIFNKEIPT